MYWDLGQEIRFSFNCFEWLFTPSGVNPTRASARDLTPDNSDGEFHCVGRDRDNAKPHNRFALPNDYRHGDYEYTIPPVRNRYRHWNGYPAGMSA